KRWGRDDDGASLARRARRNFRPAAAALAAAVAAVAGVAAAAEPVAGRGAAFRRPAVLLVHGDPAGRRVAGGRPRLPHRPRLARPGGDGAFAAGGADRRRGPELRHPF